jgi:hypothetical protein
MLVAIFQRCLMPGVMCANFITGPVISEFPIEKKKNKKTNVAFHPSITFCCSLVGKPIGKSLREIHKGFRRSSIGNPEEIPRESIRNPSELLRATVGNRSESYRSSLGNPSGTQRKSMGNRMRRPGQAPGPGGRPGPGGGGESGALGEGRSLPIAPGPPTAQCRALSSNVGA